MTPSCVLVLVLIALSRSCILVLVLIALSRGQRPEAPIVEMWWSDQSSACCVLRFHSFEFVASCEKLGPHSFTKSFSQLVYLAFVLVRAGATPRVRVFTVCRSETLRGKPTSTSFPYSIGLHLSGQFGPATTPPSGGRAELRRASSVPISSAPQRACSRVYE